MRGIISDTGTKQVAIEDNGDSARITTTQDVTDILEYAHDMRTATAGARYGDLRKVAVMPAAVVGQAMREGWLFDQKKVRQWVMENKKFLTFDKGF